MSHRVTCREDLSEAWYALTAALGAAGGVVATLIVQDLNKEGINISRTTLRIVKGLLAGLVFAALAVQGPEIVRYIKSETM